jgi:hypothetical protein
MSPDYDLKSAVAIAGLDVDLSDFLEAHPSGRAPIWALRNNSIGPRIWRQMAPDDLVIFYGNKEIYAWGFVSAKVHWPNNNYVWPTGSGWDWIYSLRDVHLIANDERQPTTLLRHVLSNFASQPTQLHDLEALGLAQEEVARRLGASANVFKVPVAVRTDDHTSGSGLRPSGADDFRMLDDFMSVERHLRSKTHKIQEIQKLLMAFREYAEGRGWKPLQNVREPFLVLAKQDVKLLVEAKEAQANPLFAVIDVIGQLAMYEYLRDWEGRTHKVALFESPINDRWLGLLERYSISVVWFDGSRLKLSGNAAAWV